VIKAAIERLRQTRQVEKRRVSAVRLSVSGIVTAFTRITGTNYGNSERLKAIFTVFYNFDIQEDGNLRTPSAFENSSFVIPRPLAIHGILIH
jgi:hypothetical protein